MAAGQDNEGRAARFFRSLPAPAPGTTLADQAPVRAPPYLQPKAASAWSSFRVLFFGRLLQHRGPAKLRDPADTLKRTILTTLRINMRVDLRFASYKAL